MIGFEQRYQDIPLTIKWLWDCCRDVSTCLLTLRMRERLTHALVICPINDNT